MVVPSNPFSGRAGNEKHALQDAEKHATPALVHTDRLLAVVKGPLANTLNLVKGAGGVTAGDWSVGVGDSSITSPVALPAAFAVPNVKSVHIKAKDPIIVFKVLFI